MKSKRQKKIRQEYNTYRQNLDFPKNPNILIDGNFLKIAIDIDFDIFKKLENVFQEKVRLKTTKCVKNELKSIGDALKHVYQRSMEIEEIKCKHEEEFLQANFCLKSILGYKNKDKFILASQDEYLRKFYEESIFPLIYFFRGNILKMEEISIKSKNTLKKKENKISEIENKEFDKIRLQNENEKKIEEKKNFEKIKRERMKLGIKIKKKAKSPNPLSMKKKIKKNNKF